jgi:alpha-amylase/alpha-mannosidase (GH57 family)
MPLHVAFLWHMHQPYYTDPVRGVTLMPWVRLHATKGYHDMIWLAGEHPGLHCVFNLTPVLVKQLRQLADGEVRDLWHELSVAPAEALTPQQKLDVLEHFFKANWDNMVRPHPRYWSLLQKRGLNTPRINLARVAPHFSEQDYRDLQVWFNLTWFGYAALRRWPELAELRRNGGPFTEADKQLVLDRQRQVLVGLLDLYKAAQDRGQVELSTTPFYHPILPLIYNTEFARRCMPGRELPPPFAHPDDARAQLLDAREFHARVFGRPPRGLWPSEGAVCPELIPLLDELGYEWFATDEEVLWRSLAAAAPGAHQDRSRLYQPCQARFGDAAAAVVFRDRTLSDFIGFNASRNEPHRAAEFVIGHLERIADAHARPDALCAIILDGENAWEHFPDGGEAFLRELYSRLSAHQTLRPATLQQYLAEHPPDNELSTLHTGSWINADFDIWIGEPEENRAWELLGTTRRFLQAQLQRAELTADQRAAALEEMHAAEGSDWFWWYGGDFATENDLIFDELFRLHLQNVYHAVGAPVPDVLHVHICRSEITTEKRRPTALIAPQIDGRVTSYYEWIGAGVYDASNRMTTMYRGERVVESIHFGFDMQNLFLRLDLRKHSATNAKSIRINFIKPRALSLVLTGLRDDGPPGAELRHAAPDRPHQQTDGPIEVKADSVIEVCVPFRRLGWRAGQSAAFFAQVMDDHLELERHPYIGTLNFTVPDDRFELQNWSV